MTEQHEANHKLATRVAELEGKNAGLEESSLRNLHTLNRVIKERDAAITKSDEMTNLISQVQQACTNSLIKSGDRVHDLCCGNGQKRVARIAQLEAQLKAVGRAALESIQDLSSFKSATASADKIAELESQIANIEKEFVFVPGEWECRECGFSLTKKVMSFATGQMGYDTKENLELCPNDGLHMFPVKWIDLYQKALVASESVCDRANDLEIGLDWAINQIIHTMNGTPDYDGWKTKLTRHRQNLLEEIKELTAKFEQSRQRAIQHEANAKRWEWVKKNCMNATWHTSNEIEHDPQIELDDETIDKTMAEMEWEAA